MVLTTNKTTEHTQVINWRQRKKKRRPIAWNNTWAILYKSIEYVLDIHTSEVIQQTMRRWTETLYYYTGWNNVNNATKNTHFHSKFYYNR